MSLFSFSREAAAFDVTPIENDFLLNYMPAAPEDALRVYLYARMLCLHPEMGGELSDMARALRMEEDAVLDAFQYWEQRGLVEKLSDRPAQFELRSLRDGRIAPDQMDLDVYRYGEFHAALNKLFDKDKLEKRHYVKACDWLDVWGMSQDAAVAIVRLQKRMPGGQTPDSVFKRADRCVQEWAEKGLHTLEDVKPLVDFELQAHDMATAVLEQLNIKRGVTENEMDCARRWIGEWRLTTEDVIRACAETTKSRTPSIAYLDAVLRTQVRRGDDHFAAMKEVLRELNAANPNPTPEQLNAYAGYMAGGFEPETVRLAAVQNARKNKNRFEDLDWMLRSWGEAGVRTRVEAEAYIRDLQQKSDEMGAYMKAAGLTRKPNRVDLEYFEAWKRKYTPEFMQCAAELARSAGDPLKRMDALLAGWADAGITTLEAARAAAPRIAKEAEKAAERKNAPRQQNYMQHQYSEEDFGKGFFYDLNKDHPKEGGNS